MSWNLLSKRQWAHIAVASALLGCGQLPGGSTTVEPKWSSLYSSYLKDCASCHAPGAPGKRSDGSDTTLDFSTASAGYTSVTSGMASGLVGNFADCNGVAYVVSGHPESSLLVASVDQATRQSFMSGSCVGDTISDMPVKMSGTPMPAGFVDALKTWITNGAQNN